MLGLYVHVPFCSAICNYCNFNRGLFDPALKLRYVTALVREIQSSTGQMDAGITIRSVSNGKNPRAAAREGAASSNKRQAADTIFFGGGTPSLLEPGEVRRIIEACAEAFDVDVNREVTLEANPETVTEARLAAYREAGVNRLSFGVQSFNDVELKRLSRLHGAERACAAVAEARHAGFDNLSLDLMMWLPGQSVHDWLESVDRAIALEPDHLSLYLLEVYPNAPLKDEMARARWSQAPDEDAAAMYETAMERLELAGLLQYEISNVARPRRQSRHNLKYWTDGEWLGFGCGAHSTRDGVRWKNVPATEDYIGRILSGGSAASETRRMSEAERLGDALFMGLRLTEGIDFEAVGRRYGVDLWQRYGPALERYIDARCLIRDGARLRLTRQGMLLANEVMSLFV